MRRIMIIILQAGLCLFFSCSSSSNPADITPVKTLKMISVHNLDFEEPSGLTLDSSEEALWVVGNNPQRIYRIDLQGNTLEMLNYNGSDMEGIVFNPLDSTLWVVEERTRNLVQITLNGIEIQRKVYSTGSDENSGLEGVAINSSGDFFIINEKNPGLFLALNDSLNVSRQMVLDFAEDYSGAVYDKNEQGFWIVSDQDRKLYLWREAAGVVEEYDLSFPKAEGVTINAAGDRIYIASETQGRLYVFTLEEESQ